MTTRTLERTVTFVRPFAIGKRGESHPPGRYLVQTDEEMIPDVSFLAWRRIVTMIHVRNNGAMQAEIVDPAELELSLARDAAEAFRLSGDSAPVDRSTFNESILPS